MIHLLFFIAVFLMSSACHALDTPAREENTITWMLADFPPLRIIGGPFAGQGPSDMIHELMRRELPEFDHKTVTANVARTVEEIKNRKQVLTIGLIPTPERNEMVLFSLPCALAPPVALIVRQEDLSKYPATVSLGSFIETDKLGISLSRSYGATVDAALRQIMPNDNVFIDSSDKLFENLAKMLLLKRIDGVLGFPFEAMFNAKTSQSADRIAIIPITETEQYVIGRIAAPKTEWGRKMISRVNEILLHHRPEPSYRQAFERWLPPANVPDFKRIYDAQFLEQQ